MRSRLFAFAALMAGMLVSPAATARDVEMRVAATAMPWNPGINRKMDFGRHDGTRPALVVGALLQPGSRVDFSASGQTTTVKDGLAFGPDGQQEFVTDAATGNSGTAFPSRYIEASDYPVHLNALMGAFIDADGRVVGKPFVIGSGTSRQVPEGAQAISMGLNDEIYSDNAGQIVVQVHIPEANVTLEPEGGK